MPVGIETLRLQLRPIALDDLAALAQLWSDPEVMRYLPTGEPRSRQETRVELTYMLDHWPAYGYGTFAVRLKGQTPFIGYFGIQHLHEEPGGVSAEALQNGTDVEVIAGLAKPYWGQGLATEATKAVLRYGFETVRLPRIVAAIHPANAKSRHILESVGLVHDPTIDYYHQCPHFVIRRDSYRADESYYTTPTDTTWDDRCAGAT